MLVNFFDNNKFKQELFDKALLSYKNEDKIAWTKNIVNTDMEVLAINSRGIKEIVKAIPKGLEKEFLENIKINYYEATIVYAKVLNKQKSFADVKKYLLPYAESIDNWASCDALSLEVKKEFKQQLFNLAVEFTESKKAFVRRVGFRLFFKYIGNEYIDKIFDIVDKMFLETEYYVNMIISWLLCEMFIKNRVKTMEYLNRANLNTFVKNKFVGKCVDSYRVSKSDKIMLKQIKD